MNMQKETLRWLIEAIEKIENHKPYLQCSEPEVSEIYRLEKEFPQYDWQTLCPIKGLWAGSDFADYQHPQHMTETQKEMHAKYIEYANLHPRDVQMYPPVDSRGWCYTPVADITNPLTRIVERDNQGTGQYGQWGAIRFIPNKIALLAVLFAIQAINNGDVVPTTENSDEVYVTDNNGAVAVALEINPAKLSYDELITYIEQNIAEQKAHSQRPSLTGRPLLEVRVPATKAYLVECLAKVAPNATVFFAWLDSHRVEYHGWTGHKNHWLIELHKRALLTENQWQAKIDEWRLM